MGPKINYMGGYFRFVEDGVEEVKLLLPSLRYCTILSSLSGFNGHNLYLFLKWLAYSYKGISLATLLWNIQWSH